MFNLSLSTKLNKFLLKILILREMLLLSVLKKEERDPLNNFDPPQNLEARGSATHVPDPWWCIRNYLETIVMLATQIFLGYTKHTYVCSSLTKQNPGGSVKTQSSRPGSGRRYSCVRLLHTEVCFVWPRKIWVASATIQIQVPGAPSRSLCFDAATRKYVLCNQEKSGWQARLSKFRFWVHPQGPSARYPVQHVAECDSKAIFVWDHINIFQGHILLFCMTERSNISLKIDIIIFKFVQFCSMGKIERDPPPVLGNFGSAISPFQNQRERLLECWRKLFLTKSSGGFPSTSGDINIWFPRKSFPQTFYFQLKTFLQTFWFWSKTLASVQTFWIKIKTFPQTLLIKRKVSWQIFLFQMGLKQDFDVYSDILDWNKDLPTDTVDKKKVFW